MIQCRTTGDFKKTMGFLKRIRKLDLVSILKKYGDEGVEALKAATPVRTGKTAESWAYEIVRQKDTISIYWTNSNIQEGVPIAVILNYGHATAHGGFVQGTHYITPAIRPVFEKIAEAAWKEVTNRHAL